MRIGGFQKLSLIDYPGKVAAVIFTQGCNFRCPYCHNPALVTSSSGQGSIPEGEVLQYLSERRGKLQGVVVTGGEPTLQRMIVPFLTKIKTMGFGVKLDTNGSRPDILQDCLRLQLLDYVAMDIKAPLEKYHEVVGVSVEVENIYRSIQLILQSDIPHMFRTTLVKPLLKGEDLPAMVSLIQSADEYHLQNFVYQDSVLDPTLLDQAQFTEEEITEMKELWEWKKKSSALSSAAV